MAKYEISARRFGSGGLSMQTDTLLFSKYQPYFQEAIRDYLCQCDISLEEGQYFASAIWGAVFVEAFLTELLISLQVTIPAQVELNELIQRLRQYSKNPPASPMAIPDEIIKRCDDIRNTRNRLVHSTGLPKKTIEEDARYICAGIHVILEWYKNTHQPLLHDQHETKVKYSGPRVFISANTPDNARQANFLEKLLSRLISLGIEPVRMHPNQFDKRDPIGRIKELISTCQGILVIGLERTHSYFLRDREGTGKQQEDVHRKYPSGWLHLEAGIASALGLDVFILCQADLCNDGIFDRNWNSYVVTEIESLDEKSEMMETSFPGNSTLGSMPETKNGGISNALPVHEMRTRMEHTGRP